MPTPTTDLYFEAHITIDPPTGEQFLSLKSMSSFHGFKIADLFLRKPDGSVGAQHTLDAFCTFRSKDWIDINLKLNTLLKTLPANGFVVRRYKIENTLLDKRLK